MSRRKPRSEPTCPRCGNEEDLREWFDLVAYCPSCLQCPHDLGTLAEEICVLCLRDLYTIVTFEGRRIIDIELYVREAWQDYGVAPFDLLTWTFFEQEPLGLHESRWIACEPHIEPWRVTKPPPHHLVTLSSPLRMKIGE